MLITESSEPVEIRRAALRAIDTHLAARGLSQLVKGQPTHIFNGQGDTAPPRKRKRKSKTSDSLKRPVTADASYPAKKPRQAENTARCVVCGGPRHGLHACPIVIDGPERYVQI